MHGNSREFSKKKSKDPFKPIEICSHCTFGLSLSAMFVFVHEIISLWSFTACQTKQRF